MYNIIFYEDDYHQSTLRNELLLLAEKALISKDARIQFKQITLYIELLKTYGQNLSSNITKHLDGEIWELRPGVNRILYFYYSNDAFVLLHMFRKSSNKTPRHELEKARKEIYDFKIRNRGQQIWEHGKTLKKK